MSDASPVSQRQSQRLEPAVHVALGTVFGTIKTCRSF